jgi:hypothetical protein
MDWLNLERVQEPVIDRYLAYHNLPKTGRLPTKASRLHAYYHSCLQRSQIREVLQCDQCGGYSDAGLPECPYCGQTDAPAALPAATNVTVVSVPVSEPASDLPDGPDPGDEPEPEADPESEPSELVTTERDLDVAVDRIKRAGAGAVGSLWKMGCELKRVHDVELWRLRRTTAGTVAHGTFGGFCREELGISSHYGYLLMQLAAKFSEQEVARIGPYKLRVVLQLADKAKAAQTAGTSAAPAPSGDTATPRPNPRTDGVTVALMPGVVELRALKRSNPAKRAKSIADDPWAKLELENAVELHIRLTSDADGLLFLVEAKRVRE